MARPFVSELLHLFSSPRSIRYYIRYHDGMKLAGIIYLHDISQDRITEVARKNLSVFKKLCGDRAVKHVVLATTKWSSLANETINQRETELRETFWTSMSSKGSPMTQFKGTMESAQEIVRDILTNRSTDVSLRIQKELVDLKKYLPQTDAGKTLYYDLKRLLDQLKGELTELRNIDQADRGQDDTWQKDYDDVKERIQSIVAELETFKVPLIQKILGLVGLQSGISFKCVHSCSIILLWSSLIYHVPIDSQRRF